MKSTLLTKSKYMNGVQCLKLAWTVFNDPAKIPEPDTSTMFRFDQGHQVTGLAQRCFPLGAAVPVDDFMGNVKKTRELVSMGVPLFEAGFLVSSENIYSRVDILKPVDDGRWDIIEVKSSTRVKDEYIEDVAFQKYCLEKSGFSVRRCSLMHINNKYTKDGSIDPQCFFSAADITDEVSNAAGAVPGRIAEITAAVHGQCPSIPAGTHCSSPYDCPLYDLCHAFLPEYNVLQLYRGGKQAGYVLIEQGITELKEIPASYKLTDKQLIQRDCAINGACHTGKRGIKAFLNRLVYPLYYLDFETFHPAIPLVDGTHPYQQVPFQFSLHVEARPGARLVHHPFLSDNSDDPRPGLLAELKQHIGTKGSILSYNKSFEENALKDMAEAFPEYGGWVDSVMPRIIDLIEPFRDFHYYHPDQYGSASLKDVLPALTGKGYYDLAIQDGETAGIAYLSAMYGATAASEKAAIRENLLKYCGRDTEGMAWVVEGLRELG